MNSLEALERVKTAPEFNGCNSAYRAYTQSSIPFNEDIETIRKDLEKLNTIKKIVEYNAGCNDTDTLNKVWKELNK